MSMLELFAARVAQDPRLRSRLHAVEGVSRGEVVEGISHVAQAFGFELSQDELECAFGGSTRSGELTAFELGKLSGGASLASPALSAALRSKLGDRARDLMGGA